MDSESKKSFSKVRADVTALSNWAQYLRKQNEQQKKEIQRLHMLQRRFVSHEAVAKLVKDNMPKQKVDHEKHVARMGHIEDRLLRVEELLSRKPPVEQPKVRVSNLKRKIANNVGRQSKEYIKRAIVSVCEKYDHMSATQLREIVVDEQKLCSRSSFYRLLDELTAEQKVNVVSSGKERILAANRKLFKH